jgi:hypothetical protein
MATLGQVFIQAAGRGEHGWEARALGRSTIAGDALDILDFGLRPLPEGNGSVTAPIALNQPPALLTRDEFNQASGNLNGKGLAAAKSLSLKSAGAGADDASVGTVAWSSPGNVAVSDDSKAQANLGSGSSHYLKATNFGFEIPAGATIEGIVVEIERSGLGEAGSVRILKGGSVQAAERASGGPWPEADAYCAYGSHVDLWGASWAYTDINASNFGVAISVKGVGGGDVFIDHVRITVCYAVEGGQKWATSGDAVDLAVEEAGHTAKRTEVSDADINTGRHAIAGATVTSDVVVGVKAKRSAVAVGSGERIRGGSLARYVDTSNWLFFGPDVEAPSAPITDKARIVKRVAGAVTELGSVAIPDSAEYRSVYLKVDRRGRYFCWGSLVEGGLPRLLLAGQDNDLKEGGPLDDGKNGFDDAKTGALANARNFDQFVVWVPPLDAAIYQGLSLEVTHDAYRREGQGGWSEVTPRGEYLKLAPAGMENRKNRLVFIASPHDPELMGVGFPSNLKVAIYATPRYRTVPDPA